MAIYQYTTGEDDRPTTTTSTTTKHPILSTFAGLSLLSMAGFTLLLSIALLLFSSPLLIFFSPLLLLSGSIVAASLAGFGLAGAAAYAGVRSIKRVLISFGMWKDGNDDERVALDETMVTESGQRVKKVEEFGGRYSRRGVVVYPPANAVKSK